MTRNSARSVAQSASFIALLLSANPTHAYTGMPALAFDGGSTSADVAPAYDLALKNLIDINTASYDIALDETGLIKAPASTISPGSGYKGQIWTRDASVNSMSAGSLLEPAIATATLWSACVRQQNGKLIINQTDGQFWDRAIWISAAWNHYAVTGDRAFLANAYEAATESLAAAERDYLDQEYGLFRGPSHINDGSSGYLSPPVSDPETGSASFGYSDVLKIMALSTNVVHYAAYLDAAQMADALGRPATEAAALRSKAALLKTAIRLDWPSPTAIRKIRLFDRIDANDQITSGTLDFSDGSSLPVGALPNDGFSALELSFASKSVTWVKLTITGTSATTYEPGLAEIEVYGDVDADPSAPGEAGAAGTGAVTTVGVGGAQTTSGGSAGLGGAGLGGGGVSLGSSGSAGSAVAGSGNAGTTSASASHGGCSCTVYRAPHAGSALGVGLALAGLGLARRRRRRA